ncbi:MAG: hypothetical protein LBS12_03915 [Prevotellaceae bacterium]|jgi:hypothetical protein|nr:hypothetical protein [Prevotellaceae bacterium]
MAREEDWMGQTHEKLYRQSAQTVTYLSVTENRNRMGFTADTPLGDWFDTAIKPIHTALKAAFETWQNDSTRTTTMTTVLYGAEAAFTPLYRQLYRILKSSPLVHNDDLVAMGLPSRPTGGRHPAPVATTAPVCEPDTSVIRCVTLHYFRSGGTHRKGKPAGQHGVEIRWAILDTQPVDIAELVHSSFDTKTPFTLEFEGHDRGKMLYFAMRWENTTGAKGPWSEIMTAVIP